MAVLSERERVSHLLRRFAFGANLPDIEVYLPLGYEGALSKLLDWQDHPDLGHPVQYAYSWEEGKDAEPGGYRFRLHWIMQMMVTQTPLREKLALFWHDHFACNEEDVQHGIAMLDYMADLRKNPAGKFHDILSRMSQSVAVMRQLNVEMLSRALPNENFARELLELYTLGEGNYTESDIKEISRALTGWSHHDVFWRLGQTHSERIEHMLQYDTPGVFFINAPAVRIEGKKSILGKQLETAEEVLALLSSHPLTAKYICTKLWEYFAYLNPEPTVIDRLSKVFLARDGDIREVLREMTRTDEFWSDKCVLRQIKSPSEFVVGVCRAQNVRTKILKEVNLSAKPTDHLPQKLFEQLGAAMYWISEAGQNIFFPPTVAGWDWGEGWVSTYTLLRRKEVSGLYTYFPETKEGKTEWYPDEPMLYVVNEIKKRQPKSSEAIVNALCFVYDCQLGPEQQDVLLKQVEKMGGINALNNDRHLAWVSTECLKLLTSAPEFHLC